MREEDRPRKAPLLENSDDDDDDKEEEEEDNDQNEDPPEPELEPPLKKIKNVNYWAIRDSAPLAAGVSYSDDEIEDQLAFCCYKCGCSEKKRQQFEDDPYICPDQTSLWHRRCCHDAWAQEFQQNWLPPYDVAMIKAEDVLLQESTMGCALPEIETRVLFKRNEVRRKYRTAKAQESELYNDDEIEGEQLRIFFLFVLYTVF